MLKIIRACRAAFLLLICLITNTAHAVSIVSTGSRYESGGVRYYFTVTQWEGTTDRICSDMTALRCDLRIYGLQPPSDYIGSTHYWNGIKPSTSLTEVRNQMKGFSIPFHGTLFVPKGTKVNNRFCITFTQQHIYSLSQGLGHRVGPCAPVIKPALQCEIKGDTIINHGSVSDNNINGNEAATTLQLTCTGISSVIATASKESPSGIKLRTDGSLYSKLTVEGKAPADGVPIKVEEGVPTPIFIKSTLFSKGTVEPGEFSGSTVLTISPP